MDRVCNKARSQIDKLPKTNRTFSGRKQNAHVGNKTLLRSGDTHAQPLGNYQSIYQTVTV